jgi:hypothetical protein
MKLPFDEYEIRARISPALIVSIPALCVVYAVAPSTHSPFKTAGIGTLLEVAVLYLLGRIARDRGYKQQNRLFDQWGGPPTTRILRHNNTLIDAVTKERLKITLQTICGLTFPTEDEERNNPARADTLYGSAIKALLEQRRDKKYRLIFNENCNYGFARNLYGVRWLGATVAGLCLAVAGIAFYLQGFSSQWAISAGISAAVLLILAIYVSADFVKRSAEAYAVALLRSSEPQPRAQKAPKRKQAAEKLE